MRRGQIWTLLRGGSQHRVLVISNDEYNSVEELAIWALTVVREVPHPKCRFSTAVHYVTTNGFVSHDTMKAIEAALREFLELP